MNLRVKKKKKKRRVDRRGDDLSVRKLCGVLFILVMLLFGVFAYATYLDGKSQSINKVIAKNDREIYTFQREIQNLKITIENKSRKQYITARIRRYRLGLHAPSPNQVIYLKDVGGEDLSNNEAARRLASYGN